MLVLISDSAAVYNYVKNITKTRKNYVKNKRVVDAPRVVFALKIILRGTLRSLAHIPAKSHISVNLVTNSTNCAIIYLLQKLKKRRS
jgi:hypothetical protein